MLVPVPVEASNVAESCQTLPNFAEQQMELGRRSQQVWNAKSRIVNEALSQLS